MKSERQNSILKILDEQEFVTVEQLSRLLYASLPTIRRDLADLAHQGLVLRSHGGAAAVKDERTDIPFSFRTGAGRDAKIRMCRAAAQLIRDGDTVFIDASTSCMYISNFLKGLSKLTVVTNSVPAVMQLSEYDFDIHCTGGRLLPRSMAYVGSHVIEFTTDFHFDLMFFSSSTVSESGAITDYSQPETELRRRVMQYADKKVMLCDSSKIGKSSAYFMTNMKEIDLLITDSDTEFAGVEILHV